MRIALAFAVALIACTSTKPPPEKPDAGSAAMRTCTGSAYDPCGSAGDCTSGMCQFYMMSNFTVCTQPCDATNPCPKDAAGQTGTCNMKGLCKPTVANGCNP